MKSFWSFQVLLACLLTLILAERVKFNGYKSHRFMPETEKQLSILKSIEKRNPGVIFLRHPGRVGSPVDIMTPPHLSDVLHVLKDTMSNEVLMEDAELIIQEHEDKHRQTLELIGDNEFTFEAYWPYDKVMLFYDTLADAHPQLCTVETYGQSSEGRALKGITLSKGRSTKNTTKPMAFIDGGNHAREWVTVSSCCYMLSKFVEPASELHKMLDFYDVTMTCVTNPDGYKYSWDVNRLWRKTRTTNSDNLVCPGVDPNRNWSYGFGKSGTSNNPCSDVYHGGKPYSISETRSLRDFIASKNCLTYCSFHSYSQLILLSYGCDEVETEYPEFDQHLATANKGVKSFAADGTTYDAGKSNVILYSACGTSADSVLNEKLSEIAYTFELRDTGKTGFLLPADQILPCGIETSHAWQVMHEDIMERILLREERNE